MKALGILTGTTFIVIVWLILLVSACAPAPSSPTTAPTSEGTAESGPAPQQTQESSEPAVGISTAVAARTPIPTPTRTNLEQRVVTFAANAGLSDSTFLGVSTIVWLELASALLLIVAGYFIVRLLVNRILRPIVGRTKTKLDDVIFDEVDNELRWFVVLSIANFTISGLSFLSDSLRTAINDIFFLLSLGILTAVVLGLIRAATTHYKSNLITQDDRHRLDPVVTTVQRLAYFFVLILALGIGLAYFGVDTNTFLLTVLVVGAILALAARDVITDLLSGLIILADQPFRVGDSVHLRDLNTWGDVLEIGTRTTRVRTVDNRELIVPNSQVSKSMIVNYNYPDTRYRLETDLGVAYGIDIDRVRKTATKAVRSVEGVLSDEPVDVLFIEFDDSARKVRVRWWIATFHDKWQSLDRVNVALELAFEKAHIEMPHETYDLRVHIEDEGDIAGRPRPPDTK